MFRRGCSGFKKSNTECRNWEAIRCRLMLGVRNGPFSPFCKGLEAVEGVYHRESHPRHPIDVEDVERKIDVQYMVVTLL